MIQFLQGVIGVVVVPVKLSVIIYWPNKRVSGSCLNNKMNIVFPHICVCVYFPFDYTLMREVKVSLNCEPKGCLWSKECAAPWKHDWEYPELQQMIHGSHSPGQQFSFSLVEADNGWRRFPLSKAGQLIQQGWLTCPGLWDYLIFQVWDCPICLLLQQWQNLLTDRSTVREHKSTRKKGKPTE